MKKLNDRDLRDLVVSGENLRDELREDGKLLSAAIVGVLCEVAQAHSDTLDFATAAPAAPAASAKAEEKPHRHLWWEDGGAVVCSVAGCTAKPRKKKEAPAAEGGLQP